MNLRDRMILADKAVNQTLDYIRADDSLVIHNKAKFLREFYYLISHTAKGACGGYRGGKPFIRLSSKDRYFDGASVMAEARSWVDKHGIPKQRPWADQFRHAQKGLWMSVEYAAVHNDPEIGKIISDDPYHHILMTVTHEIAHALVYFCQRNDSELFNRKAKPHGVEWQSLYRALRNGTLNPLLNSSLDLPMAANTGDRKMASKKAGKKGAVKKKRAGKKATAKKATVKKSTGAVAKVWAICESMKTKVTNGTATRGDVIAACVKTGLNKSTAATQYQKWKAATYN